MIWLDTQADLMEGTGWGGRVALLYSQNARPCGPLEGSIVHLLQVYVFFELPVGKDSFFSGVGSFKCEHS